MANTPWVWFLKQIQKRRDYFIIIINININIKKNNKIIYQNTKK